MGPAKVIGAERYITLVTRRRDGSTVSTPVWVADLGDGTVGFTTEAASGKVKRLRNFPEVTMQPCDRRGVVADGSPTWTGRAEVRTGPDAKPTIRAIRRKYGWQVVAIDISMGVRSLLTRRRSEDVAVIVTPDAGSDLGASRPDR